MAEEQQRQREIDELQRKMGEQAVGVSFFPAGFFESHDHAAAPVAVRLQRRRSKYGKLSESEKEEQREREVEAEKELQRQLFQQRLAELAVDGDQVHCSSSSKYS